MTFGLGRVTGTRRGMGDFLLAFLTPLLFGPTGKVEENPLEDDEANSQADGSVDDDLHGGGFGFWWGIVEKY